MPDSLLEAHNVEKDTLYNVLTRVIQESNRNIKKLDETIAVLAKGQDKLSSALIRIEERHDSDLTRIEEKHEENRERFTQQEGNYYEQARNLEALKIELRKDISDLKMRAVGYDKDFEAIKENLNSRSATQTKVISGIVVAIISALVIAFIVNK